MNTEKSTGIIVGAGIVGLTLALECHQNGIPVRVFESANEIKALGVGLNLLPHSVKHLLKHGLEAELSRNAIRTKELRFYCKSGKLIWTEPRGIEAGYKVPQYSIHRGTLQSILLKKVIQTLGEDAVLTDRRLLNFHQSKESITAQFQDTSGTIHDIDGLFLIGADGINSTVRQQLYPDQGDPQFAGLMLWRGATWSKPFLTGRSMIMAGHNDQKIVVYPMTPVNSSGKQLLNWVAEFRVPLNVMRKDDWNGKGSLQEFAHRFAHWDYPWLETNNLFRYAEAIYKFPMIDREPVDQWSFDRVTLAGDAAHAMYPNGSNGASQGILDAVSLAKWISETNNPAHAFVNYQEERLPPTARLTLDNRKTGPERVMQMVEDQCQGDCGEEHQCVPYPDLESVSLTYKKLAGFDKKTVNQ